MSIHKATFGGGCFWCTEAIFQQLQGVNQVVSGYSGGTDIDPSYREVCGGRTGHAEVIQVEFNPTEISYESLLRVHFATHDPTTLNAQGADRGTQYRSIVLYHSEEQKATAEKVILAMQGSLKDPVVTEITKFEAFYPAEDVHQNYYQENSEQPYCQVVIGPKLEKFRHLFSNQLK
jgi:methionine-S-sulfoxide reductase